MKTKPDLTFWKLWNLSFGFFGVQIAYALQSANISRIFRTLGADPHNLSFFWILPPLMGILVQPIVGTLSDKTWCRFGRRIPYLFVGAAMAVAVMCLLPNSGSLAYSIQSFLCNAGSVVGFLFPFVFTWIGLKNTAPEGVVPPSVVWSFYIGAAILILCVIYTTLKVKEWNPQEYRMYNPVSEEKEDKANWFALLKNAPSMFWKVGLVQFFCWSALLYMWTYVTDAVSETVWGTTDSTTEAYQVAGNWTGVLYAIQAMGSVVWATLLPRFKSTKLAYAMSLVLGGIGFALIPFCPDKYLQIVPFLLIGCGWAAMLAMPFTFVTNALQGYGHMGAYLGLFNGTICVPQIVAALLGGTIFTALGGHQSTMMIVSGVLMGIGALCVAGLKDKKAVSN